MKIKRIFAALLAAATLGTGAFAYTPYGPAKAEPEAEEDYGRENPGSGVVSSFKPRDYQYQMFEQILDAYVEKHLYEFTEEEVLHKFFEDFLKDNPMYFSYFMEYILGTMDPYSSYYDASSNFLEPPQESKGFGFIISDNQDGVYIKEVIDGANAKDAGLMAGDKFVSIAGINVENQSYDVVTAILAKPDKYTPAVNEDSAAAEDAESQEAAEPAFEITVRRNGELFTTRLSRGPMYLSLVEGTVVENDGKPTGYIYVSSFLGDKTSGEFVQLVKEYADDGIKHLTIDLRDNGGGSLDYALEMVEIFLEKDEVICYYDDRTLQEPMPIYSTNDKVEFDSITVLINENSASAAELFTSILQDKGLAKVIGTKSYGKSLGQEVYTLANGDYITITTYQMLNENLESYDGIGIIPDLAIEDVEMCYTLPSLGIFNHQNYVEIKEGVYSDVTKALEDRMVVMDILREEYCDGIFDEETKTALYVLQTDHNINASGYVDFDTVSVITKIINSYKSHTYYDNTQYDVAMIVHHSFSQGKRLVAEKERLREKQAGLISERDAALEAEYDALHPENASDSTETEENN